MTTIVEPAALDVDLNLTPLCQSPRFAPHNAELVLTLACGCLMLACQSCRDQAKRTVEEWEILACTLCGYEFHDPTWETMVIDERPL